MGPAAANQCGKIGNGVQKLEQELPKKSPKPLQPHYNSHCHGSQVFPMGPTPITFGKSMFQEVNLKIIGKWVQRVEIRLVSTFDQKIIVFEELKKNFIK